MDTDFTFWLVLGMLVFLIITSISVLLRSCMGRRCEPLDRLFGLVPDSASNTDVEAGHQEQLVYVISANGQLILENSQFGPRGRSIQHPYRESPPADGAYHALCSTPPPPYDPPPAYHMLSVRGAHRKRRKSTMSLQSANSAVVNNSPTDVNAPTGSTTAVPALPADSLQMSAVRAVTTEAMYKLALEEAIRALEPMCSPGKTQIFQYCSIHCGLKDVETLDHYIDLFVIQGVLIKVETANCARYQLSEGPQGDLLQVPVNGNANGDSASNHSDETVSHRCQTNSKKTINRINAAVRTVCQSTQQQAASLTLIQKELASAYPFTRFKGNSLIKRLQLEVTSGRLSVIGDCYTTGTANSSSSEEPNGTIMSAAGIVEKNIRRPKKKHPVALDDMLKECLAEKNKPRTSEANVKPAELETSPGQTTFVPTRVSTRIKKRSVKYDEPKAARRKRRKQMRTCKECDGSLDGIPREDVVECTGGCSYIAHVGCLGTSPHVVLCSGGKCGDQTVSVLCIGCDQSSQFKCDSIPPPNEAPKKDSWQCAKCSNHQLSSHDPDLFASRKIPSSPESNSGENLMDVALRLPGPSGVTRGEIGTSETGQCWDATVLESMPNRRSTDTTETDHLTQPLTEKPSSSHASSHSSPTGLFITPEQAKSLLMEASTNWSHLAGIRKAITPGQEETDMVRLGKLLSNAVEELRKSHLQAQPINQVAIISSWTIDQVAAKLQQKGHQLYAEVVTKYAIDGAALLLLLRDDVMSRTGLSLVHGLKMWRELCDIATWT